MTHAAPIPVERTAVPSGRLGMWLFLASEVCTFGGLIATYLLLRLAHPEWIEESSHTLLPIGAANTFVLLTSSLTMVLAHAAAEREDPFRARAFLLATLALAALFLGFKAFEYSHEIGQGRVPAAGLFWTFYFSMTGLHALHVLAGMVLLAFVAATAGRAGGLRRVAPAGLYWHFVDLVWIFLFPLLYVTGR